jgi:hypothetical protein
MKTSANTSQGIEEDIFYLTIENNLAGIGRTGQVTLQVNTAACLGLDGAESES